MPLIGITSPECGSWHILRRMRPSCPQRSPRQSADKLESTTDYLNLYACARHTNNAPQCQGRMYPITAAERLTP